MASYDRKFEVVRPSLDRLVRASLEVGDLGLINPTGTSPVPLIDGEFVAMNTSYKWARASDAAVPSFAVIEDRGDPTVQASRHLSVLMGGTYEADTIVFAAALTTLGAPVQQGTVNNAAVGSVNRSGLVASAGGIILGYVTRLAASNGGRLRFLQTFV